MGAARTCVEWRPEAAQAPAPAAPPPPPVLPAGLVDVPAFIGTVGPDLTRLIGARVSLRAMGWPEPLPDLIEVARLLLADRALRILLDEDALDAMIEAMFGGSPSSSPHRATILRLPPTSGTWVAAGRLIGRAIGAGLGASGWPPAREAEPAGRILAVPADPSVAHLWFDLLVAGRPGVLALATAPEPAPAAPPPSSAQPVPGATASVPPVSRSERPVPADWRDRAIRLARAVDVAVGVRIAELRLPLAEVIGLRAGSILPIEPPETLGLTVEGVAWHPPGSTPGRRSDDGQATGESGQ